jgi:hypothetical protein
MKQTTVLADGGRLIWPSGVDIAQVGDVGMPEHLIYEHNGGEAQPGVVIEIEVWDGEPVCTRAELIAKPESQIPVRPKDLRALSRVIDNVIEAAGIQYGFRKTGPTSWGMGLPGSMEEQRDRVKSVRASRRKIDNPTFLKRIAEFYGEAPTPKLESVADEFDCSPRSAARYVTAAREAGLIDE